MRRFAQSAAVLLAVVASVSVVRADDKAVELVDNPTYVAWAKVKVGTSVTYNSSFIIGEQKMSGTIKHKLVEVTAEKVVLETTMTESPVAGGPVSEPQVDKEEVKAQVSKGTEGLPEDLKGTTRSAGEEAVTVAGKTYQCKVMTFDGTPRDDDTGSVKMTGKFFTSPEVPGGLVKMTAKLSGDAEGDVSMELKSVEPAP